MPTPVDIQDLSTSAGSGEPLYPPMKIGSDIYWASTVRVVFGTSPLISFVRVLKAIGGNPYKGMVQQDGSNEPATPDGEHHWESGNSTFEGTTIHVVTGDTDASDHFLQYHSFDTTTDTWVIANQAITSFSDYAGFNSEFVHIAARADGDVIVVYNGAPDKVMGDTKHRVDYAREEGAGWTADIALDDAAADIHYGNPLITKSATSDDMHITWQKSAAAADPWSAWVTTEGRTLDPTNNLSTIQSVSTDSAGAFYGYRSIESYDDAGTTRIFLIGGTDADASVVTSPTGVEDASDDLSSFTAQEDDILDDIDDGATVLHVYGAVGPDGILHAVYRRNDDRTQIGYTRSEDNGATWRPGQLTLTYTSTSGAIVGAAVYDRDGLKLAYVFRSSATRQTYHEHVITPTIEEMTFRPENTLLRM